MSEKRSAWKSNLGFLLAAVGSAIGLGNIWRFGYMAHEYGGSAFLIPYFTALLVAGIPIMLLEYALGHREKGSPPLSFAKISEGWEWIGWFMPIVAMFGIMLYYSVVIGWCINYFFYSFDLKWGADTESFFFNTFLEISDSPTSFGGIRIPIVTSTLFVWFICWVICYRDVSHGIEKACIIFMPLLFILTLFLVLWSLNLDGAGIAVWEHYLKPDWQKIASWKVWTAAFSQMFFTLSLGFGIMITYASYLPEKTNITKNAFMTSIINCVYSLIAGTIVFATIGFMAKAQGAEFAEVIKSGPQLAFVVYPKAISLLPAFNELFGIMFFLVLVIAGISSGISLIEAFVCAITDKFSFNRKKTVTVVCIIGFLGSTIFTTRSGLLLLDIVDHFITNYGLVAGGILECIIIGWVLKSEVLRKHVNETGTIKVNFIWDILIRYITPGVLLIILFITLKTDLANNYEGYHTDHLLIFGVNWLLISLIVAVVLTFYPWKPEKLKREHLPEEDELLV
ncbi:MAG: sodium-dependent transporter [Candidatus Aureabacteria bacterium]|nr:sodium-dependent transporter [Candidatus Auribacterota bacterium]